MSTVINGVPIDTEQLPREDRGKPEYPGIPTTADGAGMVVWVETHITQGACAYPITSSAAHGGGRSDRISASALRDMGFHPHDHACAVGGGRNSGIFGFPVVFAGKLFGVDRDTIDDGTHRAALQGWTGSVERSQAQAPRDRARPRPVYIDSTVADSALGNARVLFVPKDETFREGNLTSIYRMDRMGHSRRARANPGHPVYR